MASSLEMFGSFLGIPSGYVKIAMERSTMLLMGKSTISMAIFNSYVSLPEGNPYFGTNLNVPTTLVSL